MCCCRFRLVWFFLILFHFIFLIGSSASTAEADPDTPAARAAFGIFPSRTVELPMAFPTGRRRWVMPRCPWALAVLAPCLSTGLGKGKWERHRRQRQRQRIPNLAFPGFPYGTSWEADGGANLWGRCAQVGASTCPSPGSVAPLSLPPPAGVRAVPRRPACTEVRCFYCI